jgi:hypothetical protein
MSPYPIDFESEELARHFLAGTKHEGKPDALAALAEAIQRAADGWIEAHE